MQTLEKDVIEGNKFNCKMSEEGIRSMVYSRRKFCGGNIVGQTKDGYCYKVVWHGSKTPCVYHKSYIEIVQQK